MSDWLDVKNKLVKQWESLPLMEKWGAIRRNHKEWAKGGCNIDIGPNDVKTLLDFIDQMQSPVTLMNQAHELEVELSALKAENERLKKEVRLPRGYNETIEKMAITISGLNAENERLKREAVIQIDATDRALKQRDSFRKEVERLREALEKIAQDATFPIKAMDVAKQALGAEGREGRR